MNPHQLKKIQRANKHKKGRQNHQPIGHENYKTMRSQETPIKMAKIKKTRASVSEDTEVKLPYVTSGF